MKLFQRMLVAPAALGLMAPIAATAAELNINDVSEYSTPSGVQSISQFSDVYPTDWAYQALTNLADRLDCVAARPNGSMTRYEAAALLNKCLGNVAEVNEEEKRLLNEFGPELAVIKGRIDGLESRVGEFEAGMFSTTTKLSGQTTFVIGGADDDSGTATSEAVAFNYDTRITLDTSFSGNDLLKTVVRAGNFGSADLFRGDAALETASGADDSLDIVRNYYQFPIGDEFTATIGAKVRQDDMLGVWPSAYPTDSILDVLTYAGSASGSNGGAYSLTEGQGAGITWARDRFSSSILFVSENGASASSKEGTAGGLLTDHGSDDVTGQIAWLGDGYTLAAAYTVADGGNWEDGINANDYSAWVVSGVYEIGQDSWWLPSSISAGYGGSNPDNEDTTDTAANSVEDSTTWSVGLVWNDFFVDGNNLGFGIGTNTPSRSDTDYTDPIALEVFYEMAVSDNITVTPALFVIERDGQEAHGGTGSEDNIHGALVKTTFTF